MSKSENFCAKDDVKLIGKSRPLSGSSHARDRITQLRLPDASPAKLVFVGHPLAILAEPRELCRHSLLGITVSGTIGYASSDQLRRPVASARQAPKVEVAGNACRPKRSPHWLQRDADRALFDHRHMREGNQRLPGNDDHRRLARPAPRAPNSIAPSHCPASISALPRPTG